MTQKRKLNQIMMLQRIVFVYKVPKTTCLIRKCPKSKQSTSKNQFAKLLDIIESTYTYWCKIRKDCWTFVKLTELFTSRALYGRSLYRSYPTFPNAFRVVLFYFAFQRNISNVLCTCHDCLVTRHAYLVAKASTYEMNVKIQRAFKKLK